MLDREVSRIVERLSSRCDTLTPDDLLSLRRKLDDPLYDPSTFVQSDKLDHVDRILKERLRDHVLAKHQDIVGMLRCCRVSVEEASIPCNMVDDLYKFLKETEKIASLIVFSHVHDSNLYENFADKVVSLKRIAEAEKIECPNKEALINYFKGLLRSEDVAHRNIIDEMKRTGISEEQFQAILILACHAHYGGYEPEAIDKVIFQAYVQNLDVIKDPLLEEFSGFISRSFSRSSYLSLESKQVFSSKQLMLIYDYVRLNRRRIEALFSQKFQIPCLEDASCMVHTLLRSLERRLSSNTSSSEERIRTIVPKKGYHPLPVGQQRIKYLKTH